MQEAKVHRIHLILIFDELAGQEIRARWAHQVDALLDDIRKQETRKRELPQPQPDRGPAPYPVI